MTGDCKHFDLHLCRWHGLEEALDFVQSGFTPIAGEITFSEQSKKYNKTDTVGFVRDHIKGKTTALTAFQIDVDDLTNIEAWSEILASSPEASIFCIAFHESKLDIQTSAERFWKVLLAVLYCNNKDKTLSIRTTCDHESYEHAGHQLNVVDWSFTKNEHKRYRNVQNPGKIKEFRLPVFCPLDYSFMFYTAPIWDEVDIDRISIKGPLVNIFFKIKFFYSDV